MQLPPVANPVIINVSIRTELMEQHIWVCRGKTSGLRKSNYILRNELFTTCVQPAGREPQAEENMFKLTNKNKYMKVWCEHQLHFLGKSSTWGPEIQLYLHFDILSPEKTQQCSPWGKGIQHCQAIWAFSYGWKISLLLNVLQHCIERSKEGKSGMPCLQSKKAIARNHPDKKPLE